MDKLPFLNEKTVSALSFTIVYDILKKSLEKEDYIMMMQIIPIAALNLVVIYAAVFLIKSLINFIRKNPHKNFASDSPSEEIPKK